MTTTTTYTPITTLEWTQLAGTTVGIDNSIIGDNSVLPAGAESLQSIDATLPFQFIIKYGSNAVVESGGIVIFLEDDDIPFYS